MASGQRHERQSGRGRFGGEPASRPTLQEDTLKTEKLQIERKTFILALKQNPRGRFVRITEDVGGRRDTIIVPASGLAEFQRALNEIIKAAEAAPQPAQQP